MHFDVFWSFRSPYSYLATKRLVAIEREYDVEVRVRPVLPIAVRIPGFFKQVNPLWPPYLMRDTMRIAEHEGLDYAWPQPDPIVQDFATREVAAEQPYIYRLTRLGVVAVRARPRSGVHRRGVADHLERQGARLARGRAPGRRRGARRPRSGGDGPGDRRRSRPLRRDHRAANQRDLEAAGHWGVPTMVFAGEPFFGQDRIELLLWRMGQHGLAPRA